MENLAGGTWFDREHHVSLGSRKQTHIMNGLPAASLSMIVPFLNEGPYIGRMLDSLTRQRLEGVVVEVLFADGGSTDESRVTIEHYQAGMPAGLALRVFDNPDRTTTAGFNGGIRLASGAAIGIGGSRTIYPPDFFRRAWQLLEETGASVVGGGVTEVVPAHSGATARAIACLYQSRVGAGVAGYWRRRTSGDADTVYCGFYRREVFERLGTFDESLSRGQDNEFNSRVRQAGLRIFFHPDLSTAYQARGGMKALMRRGFVSGVSVAHAWRLNRHAFRWHHAAPLVWLTYLVLGAMASALYPLARPIYLTGMGVYVVTLAGAAIAMMRSAGSIAAMLTIPMSALYHTTYGIGTVFGLLSRQKTDK